jgi:branched-chain amino acid transport system ATP-binding protein
LTLAQRKLLDVARAACRRPRVLLLDEPYAGLDSAEVETLQAFVRDIRRDGTTVLVVEHRIPELLRIVDEVAVLAGGRILRRGPPEETVSAPEVLRAYFGVEA